MAPGENCIWIIEQFNWREEQNIMGATKLFADKSARGAQQALENSVQNPVRVLKIVFKHPLGETDVVTVAQTSF